MKKILFLAIAITTAITVADPGDAKKWNQETMTAAVEDLIVNRIEPKLKK